MCHPHTFKERYFASSAFPFRHGGAYETKTQVIEFENGRNGALHLLVLKNTADGMCREFETEA
jgi:hypothetical protein